MKEFKNYYRHGFAYNTYVCGNDKLFPNSKDEINKKEEQEEQQEEETRIVAKFNVTSTSNATTILIPLSKISSQYSVNITKDITSVISKIEIDGVEQENVTDTYLFDTLGEHTVKYTLANPTNISCVTFAVLPGTPSDDGIFSGCSQLTSIIIPSSVTSIGNYTFNNCNNLVSITSLSTTTPTIKNNTFKGVKTGGTLYVPQGTTVTGYGSWMRTDNYYLGKYGWNIVEI